MAEINKRVCVNKGVQVKMFSKSIRSAAQLRVPKYETS